MWCLKRLCRLGCGQVSWVLLDVGRYLVYCVAPGKRNKCLCKSRFARLQRLRARAGWTVLVRLARFCSVPAIPAQVARLTPEKCWTSSHQSCTGQVCLANTAQCCGKRPNFTIYLHRRAMVPNTPQTCRHGAYVKFPKAVSVGIYIILFPFRWPAETDRLSCSAPGTFWRAKERKHSR